MQTTFVNKLRRSTFSAKKILLLRYPTLKYERPAQYHQIFYLFENATPVMY